MKGLSTTSAVAMVLALSACGMGQELPHSDSLNAATRLFFGSLGSQGAAQVLLREVPVMKPLAAPAPSTSPVTGRSPARAFFLSLLLPGLGERYCRAATRGWAFTAAEAGLWAAFAAFRVYGDWRTEDYRAYAAARAGVEPRGKSHRYFVDIGNYSDIEAYNAAMLRERNLPKVYPDSETYFWAWPSEVERVRYAHLRVGADKAYQRSVMVVGAIIANHLVSAVDAMWLAKRSNRPASQGDVEFGVDWRYSATDASLRVAATYRF